ncbi:MAG: hypothetical protein U1F63_16885 [Chitinivorax sp.]
MIQTTHLGGIARAGGLAGAATQPLDQQQRFADAAAMNRLLAADVWHGQPGELRLLNAQVPADPALAAQWVLAPLQA